MYSQNEEEKYILQYFEPLVKGTFLDIGAHDGKQLSNTYQLALNGWAGVMVEPSKVVFPYLKERCLNEIPNVIPANYCIADYDGEIKFFESGGDFLGTASPQHRERCEKSGYSFSETKVPCIRVDSLLEMVSIRELDFISIDAEGWDFKILCQFPDDFYGASMVCVECSGPERTKIRSYMEERGYKMYYETAENLLMTR